MLFSISRPRTSHAPKSLLATSYVLSLLSRLPPDPCGFDQPPIGPAPVDCSFPSQSVADHGPQYQYTLHDSQTTPGNCSRSRIHCLTLISGVLEPYLVTAAVLTRELAVCASSCAGQRTTITRSSSRIISHSVLVDRFGVDGIISPSMMAQIPLDARLDSPRHRDVASRNFQPNPMSQARSPEQSGMLPGGCGIDAEHACRHDARFSPARYRQAIGQKIHADPK
ncbi:hypothetical protein FFLO_01872 [Filobasidium floriforme]|uniref:Uncharacterized protein n=2 Tax=Filobasidium floriforme TaxID=5210 RepID=A0A8K0NUI7_9TREE|nr:hypothetical protein FFLO_01872 [Filobasidium floriforme]